MYNIDSSNCERSHEAQTMFVLRGSPSASAVNVSAFSAIVIPTERSDEGSLFHNYCKYFADPHLFATERNDKHR